ncbi:hypothetical protein QUC31_016862 [Theobroma cacao]
MFYTGILGVGWMCSDAMQQHIDNLIVGAGTMNPLTYLSSLSSTMECCVSI